MGKNVRMADIDVYKRQAHTSTAPGLRARTFFSASTAACSSRAKCSGVGLSLIHI